jgi:hypothetical protein
MTENVKAGSRQSASFEIAPEATAECAGGRPQTARALRGPERIRGRHTTPRSSPKAASTALSAGSVNGCGP